MDLPSFDSGRLPQTLKGISQVMTKEKEVTLLPSFWVTLSFYSDYLPGDLNHKADFQS